MLRSVCVFDNATQHWQERILDLMDDIGTVPLALEPRDHRSAPVGESVLCSARARSLSFAALAPPLPLDSEGDRDRDRDGDGDGCMNGGCDGDCSSCE